VVRGSKWRSPRQRAPGDSRPARPQLHAGRAAADHDECGPGRAGLGTCLQLGGLESCEIRRRISVPDRDWAALPRHASCQSTPTRAARRILRAFEAAELETVPEARRAWTTFVVIGGGPTGVGWRAAGEIAGPTLARDFRTSIRAPSA